MGYPEQTNKNPFKGTRAMGGNETPEALAATVDRLGSLVKCWRALSCARTRRYDPTGETETDLSGLLTWEEHSVKLQFREIGEQPLPAGRA
jgi:hypothetical protein